MGRQQKTVHVLRIFGEEGSPIDLEKRNNNVRAFVVERMGFCGLDHKHFNGFETYSGRIANRNYTENVVDMEYHLSTSPEKLKRMADIINSDPSIECIAEVIENAYPRKAM